MNYHFSRFLHYQMPLKWDSLGEVVVPIRPAEISHSENAIKKAKEKEEKWKRKIEH